MCSVLSGGVAAAVLAVTTRIAPSPSPRFSSLGTELPAEHWRHLRTTNPIESSFATVKLRTKVTKGAGSKKAALAMAYKLLDAAQERWRRFNGHELVADVLAGVKFQDGIRSQTTTTRRRTRRSPPDVHLLIHNI